MWKPIDKDVLSALADLLGPQRLLISPEEILPYARDENPTIFARPEAVALVRSAAEISSILRLANRRRFPVVPRGAGTGVTGGALAVRGGLVVSLEKMRRLQEIDRENLMASVEPGLLTGDLHRAAEARRLFYPPDPASSDDCSLGGNLAEDAGGPRAVKYGVTRDYCRGIVAVLPSGEIVAYGGKLKKNVTGYNLLHLLIGSEGTLGIITSATLSLLPLPRVRRLLLAVFPASQSAVSAVTHLLTGRARPAAIEFLDSACLRIAREVMPENALSPAASAQLLVEVDGDDDRAVSRQEGEVKAACRKAGALSIETARSGAERAALWAARRKMRESLKSWSPIIVGQDVVVPRAAVAALVRGIERIGREAALEIACFGHAGDGNIHVNFLRRDRPAREWKRSLDRATHRVFSLAVDLGGTISGEHGIGVTKKRYLRLALGPAAIRAMRRLKQALDPNNILNPGKIF
jgi:glycolate oxidase